MRSCEVYFEMKNYDVCCQKKKKKIPVSCEILFAKKSRSAEFKRLAGIILYFLTRCSLNGFLALLRKPLEYINFGNSSQY